MTFSGKQLAAILKAGFAMVKADGIENKEELQILFNELRKFNVPINQVTSLLDITNEMSASEMFSILSGMDQNKQKYVCGYLAAIMMSDEDIDDSEMKLWQLISGLCDFPTMNIQEALEYWAVGLEEESSGSFISDLLSGSNNPCIGEVEFKSSDHVRYEHGVDVSGHNYNCHRTIKIEKNIRGREGYSVTVYNDDGVHPLWGNNVQISTKPMKVISKNDGEIELRGYGYDETGLAFGAGDAASFANYGLSIKHNEKKIQSCTMHLIERGVDLVYYE
ncbi:MAG: hypothetical protein KBT27_15675 [Prevotellaceae bacterium]|nr:hypothetical protein [Candidatus Faecinaster equi]